MANSTLKKSFFQRDARVVARELLGKYLVMGNQALIITETEAYVGPHDLASHASRGRTKRTEPMFGEAGIWYVYFVYGMHWMLNVVTGPKDYPAAVLIRAARPDAEGGRVEGINGPAKLTKALGIDKSFNACPAKRTRSGGLYFEDRGILIPKNKIKTAPRIGVAYAGPIWSKKPYRFHLVDKSKKKRRT